MQEQGAPSHMRHAPDQPGTRCHRGTGSGIGGKAGRAHRHAEAPPCCRHESRDKRAFEKGHEAQQAGELRIGLGKRAARVVGTGRHKASHGRQDHDGDEAASGGPGGQQDCSWCSSRREPFLDDGRHVEPLADAVYHGARAWKASTRATNRTNRRSSRLMRVTHEHARFPSCCLQSANRPWCLWDRRPWAISQPPWHD